MDTVIHFRELLAAENPLAPVVHGYLLRLMMTVHVHGY
jgi:hypothetical protein